MNLIVSGFRKPQFILLLLVLILATSSQSALATFADSHLIRVYYDRFDGREVVSDLGVITSLLAAQGEQVYAGSFGQIDSNSASTFAVYFAVDRVTNQLWASGSTSTPSVIVGGATGMATIKSNVPSIYPLWNTQGGATYFGGPFPLASYKTRLSATQGNLGGAINAATRIYTELPLANLANNNTQFLYYWNNGVTTNALEKVGVPVAVITTNFDGSTTLAALPTPIPAAAWLLGSGLLGLVGIRRRNA
jgi:hypothetical protein